MDPRPSVSVVRSHEQRPAGVDTSSTTEDLDALRAARDDAERLGTHLARTLEVITDAFYTLDRDWRFTFANREAERLMQRAHGDLIGRVVWEAFPDVLGTAYETAFRDAVRTGVSSSFEAFYPPLDLWTSVRVFPSDDGLAVYFLDITERKHGEQALAASEHRYRTLFERADVAIIIADDTGRYVDANDAAGTLLGLPCDEIIGRRLDDFVVDVIDGVDPSAYWAALRQVGEMHGEVRLRRPDGEIRETIFQAIADIAPGYHLGVMHDITDRRRNERAALQRLRILDALRRLSPGDAPEATAQAICDEIVAQGDFPSAAIWAFDTEDSTSAIGARFREEGPGREVPLLSPSRLARLQAMAEHGPWVDDWTDPGEEATRVQMKRLGVSAAVFAPIEADGRRIGLLVAGADEPASELGGRIGPLMEFAALASSLLGPGLGLRAGQTIERARIRQVIADHAFKPVFQPIVDMRTREPIGYEALTRFADGTLPDRAFAAAAAAGLGLELEAATIEAALDAAQPLAADCFLDINVSPDLVMARTDLRRLLRGAGAGVVLEITEHVDVQDYAALRRAISTLGRDVRFAVDDAGAGFASLRHILELAPSHVKLDRALIARIGGDPARQALVAGLVHFTQAIDVMLIAEGVETRSEHDTLVRLGVRVGQGFLYARPAPASDLIAARPTRGSSRAAGARDHRPARRAIVRTPERRIAIRS